MIMHKDKPKKRHLQLQKGSSHLTSNVRQNDTSRSQKTETEEKRLNYKITQQLFQKFSFNFNKIYT